MFHVVNFLKFVKKNNSINIDSLVCNDPLTVAMRVLLSLSLYEQDAPLFSLWKVFQKQNGISVEQKFQ